MIRFVLILEVNFRKEVLGYMEADRPELPSPVPDTYIREMDLPFLPVEGMRFKLKIGNVQYQEECSFIVKEMVWSESKNKVFVKLEKDKFWDPLMPKHLDPQLWQDASEGDAIYP